MYKELGEITGAVEVLAVELSDEGQGALEVGGELFGVVDAVGDGSLRVRVDLPISSCRHHICHVASIPARLCVSVA